MVEIPGVDFRTVPAFLATVLFSWSVVFASRTTRLLGATTANFTRLCVSTVLLAVWGHVFGGGWGGGVFGWFFLSGVIGFGIGDLALYQALPRLGPRLTILMVHCLAAPFAAVAEWWWLATPLTAAQVGWGVVVLAGVAIALAPGEQLQLPGRMLLHGVVFGVIAALGQGLGAVVSRKAFAVSAELGTRIDPLTATYQRILGGLLFAAVPSIWILCTRKAEGSAAGEGGDRWRRAWVWVLLNSLSGPTVGVACYQWALKILPSGVVLPIVATTPIVVIPFAHLMEGDKPGVRSLVGGLVAVAGVIGLTLVK